MLEIIKALVEIAAKFVGAADKLRGEQFKDIGRKLLVLYFRVNETIEGAQKIILAMEGYRRDTEWRRDNGKETIYTGTTHHFGAEHALQLQAVNLGRLTAALKDVQLELSLVDATLARRFKGLVDGKSNAITLLALNFRASRIPLRHIPPEALDAAITDSLVRHGFFDYRELVESDGEEVIKERFGSEVLYRQIVEYLDSRRPYDNVAQLEQMATAMREHIGKHWSLSETLPQTARLIRNSQ